jgi:hypothetical protein
MKRQAFRTPARNYELIRNCKTCEPIVPGMIEPELFRSHEYSGAAAVLDFRGRMSSTIAHRAWDKVFPASHDQAGRVALVWVGRAGPNTLGPAG